MSVPKLIPLFQDGCRKKDFFPQHCEFVWEVPLEYTLRKPVIFSPVLPDHSNAQFKWAVTIVNDPESPWFFLKLKEKRLRDLDISVECSFFINIENGTKIIKKQRKKLKHEYWVFRLPCNFYDCHKRLSKFGQDPLIFGVRISAKYDATLIAAKRLILERNYDYVLEGETLRYFILRTEKDGTQFKVYRLMLTWRSRMFAAILSKKRKEKLKGTANIQEFSGSIMRYVINFIYNSTVDFPDFSVALNLLEAAEYFNLKDLKNRCATHLLKFVDIKHAWQLLLNAHLFCVEDLKAIILEFIGVHKKVLSYSDEYRTFPEDLLLDVIKAFSKKKKSLQTQFFGRKK